PCFASDQYALAVMTYEWLCGWRPFYGSTYEIAEQHLTLPPSSLRARVPWLSEEIEDVVLRALAKDPADRFSSVSEFARRLEQAVDRSSAFMETGALPRVQVSLPESRPAGRSVQQTRTQQERWETMEYEEANQEPRQPPLWRKIAVLVGLGMIIELTVYVILAMLGMDLHSFWSLLASCILALPLVISYTRDHRRSFLLTGVVLIASLLGGLLTHSLWVLFSTYFVLLAILLGRAFYRHRHS
ncbi:MAG: hypothetical protein J2P36_16960, partial [Ktedonobacteraceae bacterium]|nr:hypothetical protein [Ktedonobacteraceae bacterium]